MYYGSSMSAPKKRIVTVGGGTGSFVLLSGLKEYDNADICAIVSMADDGGSTGVLRDEMGVLPPGDVRQCLAALSWATPTLRSLFSYRFLNGGMEGHNFGNLLISSLEKITGSFSEAVHEAGKIFHIQGEVLPVTEDDMRLRVKLKNGHILKGEHALDDNPDVWEHGVDSIALATPVTAYPRTLVAIEQADVIVVGPGDLYGSVAPNLLVGGIVDALKNTKAKVVYIANLTNKRGQTTGYSAHDYAQAANEYIGSDRIDILVCNDGDPSGVLRERYKDQEGEGMFVQCGECEDCKYEVVHADLLSDIAHEEQNGDALASTRSFIRHDSHKLAEVIMKIAGK